MADGQGESYYDVLTAAVNDLIEHGYDLPERVARWQARLEEAARRTHTTLDKTAEHLRETLRRTYESTIQGLARYHAGIDRVTIARVKPKLRAELDRRLMASASLIKLNRDEMIARQARRWQGWATSIPVGGPAEADRMKVKDAIRRPLASLPFEERRVFIDQGHKLIDAVNDIIAVDGGAIAAKWRAVHQAGYDHRPEHLARDGFIYLVRGSWADKQGFVKSANGYTDDITRPGEEVFCRCSYVYLYHLRQLPDDMITARGRAALELVRMRSA